MFLQVNSLHLGSKFNYYKYCMIEGSIFEKCKQEDDKGQIAFSHILFTFSIFHLVMGTLTKHTQIGSSHSYIEF